MLWACCCFCCVPCFPEGRLRRRRDNDTDSERCQCKSSLFWKGWGFYGIRESCHRSDFGSSFWNWWSLLACWDWLGVNIISFCALFYWQVVMTNFAYLLWICIHLFMLVLILREKVILTHSLLGGLQSRLQLWTSVWKDLKQIKKITNDLAILPLSIYLKDSIGYSTNLWLAIVTASLFIIPLKQRQP